MRSFVLAFVLMLGGIHAAQAAFFSDDEARKQITDLKLQVTQLQTKLDEALKQNQTTESRLQILEKNQGLVDLLGQIDRLNGEISKLKGQLEVVSHDMELTQKRQRDLYTDLDGRLRKLESGSVAATTTPPTQPVASTAPATPTATPTETVTVPAADSLSDQKDYDAAYTQIKAGKYTDAIKAFQSFLDQYPNSKLAPNALYWIGTSQYSLKDFKSSIATQQKLIKQYPDSEKSPNAMFSIANSQIQLADVDSAKQTLRALLDKYPLSDAAPLAKKRLSALSSSKSRN